MLRMGWNCSVNLSSRKWLYFSDELTLTSVAMKDVRPRQNKILKYLSLTFLELQVDSRGTEMDLVENNLINRVTFLFKPIPIFFFGIFSSPETEK